MTVFGCNFLLAGSEGMCGSWNNRGARFKDGTPMDLSGSYFDRRSRAMDLAQSWKIEPSQSLLWNPSNECDPSPGCGLGETFACDSLRARRLEVNPGCTRRCSDISIPQFREQCEKDIELTGDASWACEPTYVDPIIALDRTPFGSKWYVHHHSERCVSDCEPAGSGTCGGDAQSWEILYNDAATCCRDRLAWKNHQWCEATSLGIDYPGSGKFYINQNSW